MNNAPKTEIKEIVRINLDLPKSDLEIFDHIAKEKRTSRASLLRGCVLETIKKHKRNL